MKNRDVLAVFNRGRISRLALARTEVARVALSADIQTNWMPRTLGAMSLRPGLEYHGAHEDEGVTIPFIFSTSDTALLDLSADELRIWDDGTDVVTRASVSTAVANGTFTGALTNWTDADDAGTYSTWETGNYLQLLGTGSASARRQQQVTVSGGDTGTVHGLRIVVERGPVILRIGTTAGADDVFRQAVLRTGTHSIAFAPSGDFWIELSSALTYPTLVESCEIEASGEVVLPTPWTTADECRAVRWAQSADVVYCASGYQQRRIERRPDNSWSIVLYEANDGPFLTENTESTTLTPSDISGEITLTASAATFRSDHVGSIFRLESQGQTVEADLSADLTYTDPIRVTGVTSTRIFQIIRAGTWAGTLTLQRSVGAIGSWEDVDTFTSNGTSSHDDGLDNSIVYYRIGFTSGGYTSGTAEVSLDYAVGSIAGVARVTGYTSDTVVDAVVVKTLGGATATAVWSEGAWSDKEGWPTATAIWEGRKWWSGNGRNYGSVSDAYSSFDPDTEGDSAPINRGVGEGTVNNINWLLPLQRLVAGSDGAEHTVRSNSFDEPVTPTNYNAKAPSTKGSAAAPAVLADARGYFIDRTTRKIFEIEYDSAAYDFGTLNTTLLVPEIGEEGFTRLAVQMNPDMRVHGVRNDGTVAVLVRDAAEDVLCWVDVETDGIVEDVAVIPGATSDRVFYRVQRTIDGATVRYNEEWALEEDCRGATLNLQADSFMTGTGSMTGLDHLEGETVVIWADGVDQGTGVVTSGTVSGSYTNWVVGLGYDADYESAKLSGQTSLGLSLTQQSLIDSIGLVLSYTHAQGLLYGPDADNLDALPLFEDGAVVDGDSIWGHYDKEMIEFPGDWSTDNRIYLKASAPRPCTVLGAALSIAREDKA